MGKTAVVFPGQGAQSVGMGRDIVEVSERARSVYARAGEILGFDVAGLCFTGPAEMLERTDVQQPAIFVTSVACWEAFLEMGGSREQFSFAAGLSLGEYTALFVAGAVSFEEALRLVHRRGELMQAAATSAPSGMVSLVGANETSARALCDQARGEDVLAPANFNCPGQIVISGSRAACERAVSLAEEYQCRAVALKVAGAFHSPLMAPAAEGLREMLERTRFSAPMLTVAANVDAKHHGRPDEIRHSLRKQLTHPVRWQQCVEGMIADGADEFVEFGPGRVLTGLIRKIDRKVTVINASTAESLASSVPA